MYESVGMNLYTDYNYLEQVWKYHQRMVEEICDNNIEAGYKALVEHKDLIFHRKRPGNPPVDKMTFKDKPAKLE